MASWHEKKLLKTIKLCTQEILLHDKKSSLARYRLSEAMTEYQVTFHKEIADGEDFVNAATLKFVRKKQVGVVTKTQSRSVGEKRKAKR